MKNLERKTLTVGFIGLISVIIVIGLVGHFVLTPNTIILQGEVEATEVRVSGKLPGRIAELRVKEGMGVSQGDTLVVIDSPELDAKFHQVKAVQTAAEALKAKADAGARKEQIAGAYEIWQKAQAAEVFAKKSFDRISNLYQKGVIAAQKYDEVETQYKAASATAKAAQSQYELALNGAQKEDKLAAMAQVNQAKGALQEVEAYLKETHLTSPINGEISVIYPKQGELVGSGTPIMNVVDLNDIWITFNVREDLLSKIQKNATLEAFVPALDNKTISLKVNYIQPLAGYATWKASKLTDEYDTKTFEVRAIPMEKVENLRPGMSVVVNWTKLK